MFFKINGVVELLKYIFLIVLLFLVLILRFVFLMYLDIFMNCIKKFFI